MLHAGTMGTVVRQDQSSETVSLLWGWCWGVFFCLQPRQPRLAQAEAQHGDGEGGDGGGNGGGEVVVVVVVFVQGKSTEQR